MTYGEYRRAKPRLNVLTHWAGNEPQSLKYSAKPKLNENIYSGQVIVLDDDGFWVKATSSNGVGRIPYFAYSDALWVGGKLSTDTDVQSSGLLLGLSCLENFELQTAYFDPAPSTPWVHGDPLVLGSTAGSLAKGASALAAVEVLGFVSRTGMIDVVKTNSEALPDNAGKVLMLNLITAWRPKTA